MTAVIWKEVRENLKWAVLWLLGVAAACAAMINVQRGWQGPESLCAAPFLAVMTIGAAAGGALLGLLQTVSETRRDQWAFFIHRPATRAQLFFGKVTGGIGLLVAALGIPLLGAALWAATPGHVAAPFAWGMVLPGIADILTGIVFYFGGMLTGLRRVRWYGSRPLGLSAAIPCAVLVWNVLEFWQALLVILAFGAPLGLAAWGSFQTGGEYAPQPRVAKWALGVCMAAGLVVVVGTGVACVHELLRSDRGYTRSEYWIDQDGSILRGTTTDGIVMAVTDVRGNTLAEYESPQARARTRERTLYPTRVLSDWDQPFASYRSSWCFYALVGRSGLVNWYYVRALGLIAGYDLKDRRQVGSLGPDGPVSSAAGYARPFADLRMPNPWDFWGLLVSAHAVYRVEVGEQRVSQVFASPQGEEVRRAIQPWLQSRGASKPANMVVVATDKRLHVVSDTGAPMFSAPYHYDPQRYPNLSLALSSDAARYFLWYGPASTLRLRERENTPSHVIELAADGQELRRFDLPPILNRAAPDSWYDMLPLVFVPLGLAIAASGLSTNGDWVGDQVSPMASRSLMDELSGNSWPVVALGVALLLVSAIGCAVLMLVIGRRYAFGRAARYAWAVFGLFGGPVAVATLLALRDWPARQACPSCRRLRVVDRDLCEHCGAPFATPPRDATAIFDA